MITVFSFISVVARARGAAVIDSRPMSSGGVFFRKLLQDTNQTETLPGVSLVTESTSPSNETTYEEEVECTEPGKMNST